MIIKLKTFLIVGILLSSVLNSSVKQETEESLENISPQGVSDYVSGKICAGIEESGFKENLSNIVDVNRLCKGENEK